MMQSEPVDWRKVWRFYWKMGLATTVIYFVMRSWLPLFYPPADIGFGILPMEVSTALIGFVVGATMATLGWAMSSAMRRRM